MNKLKSTLLLIIFIFPFALKAQDTYVIDNFAPFVKKVKISSGGELIYEEEWTWNSEYGEHGALTFSSNCKNMATDGNYDAVVIIYTSEPMQSLSLKIEGMQLEGDAEQYNSKGTEWYYIIDTQVIEPFFNEQGIQQFTITIDGQDKNGTALQGFGVERDMIPGNELKRRMDASTWSEAGSFGLDTRHVLKIGTTSNETATGCLFAGFYVNDEDKIIEDNQVAEFVNTSQGAIEYEWFFEGGTPETSFEESPKVTYENEGTFMVRLTAKKGAMEHILPKPAYITVTKSQASYAELDITYNPTTAELKCVSDTDISDWIWDINSSSLSGETVTYAAGSSLPSFSVTLTVSFTADNTTKSITKVIYNCGFNR